MKILLASIAFLFLNSSVAYGASQNEAPFGLVWGQSLKDSGVECFETKNKNNLLTCQTKNVPQNLSISQMYFLGFSQKYNLQKIGVLSNSITNDIYGTEGKELYFKLKSQLSKKYGKPVSEIESIGQTLYKDEDEFYQCLKYDGCGMFTSIFESQGISVSLKLNGMIRGMGYIFIIYEGPNWGRHVNETKENIDSGDLDSL